jgi:orotidine-5'-phosphate decarboxylase
MHVVEKSMHWADHHKLGYVVGATHPDELARVRKAAKDNVLLIPGIGSQGGDAEAMLRANAGGPAIVNVSRAVIFASENADFAEQSRRRAIEFKKLLRV